jgi:hypothetical protein
MEIRIEYITRDKARDMVAQSPYKPNDPGKVKHYAEVMNNGEWVDATAYHLFRNKHYVVPLIFTDEGFLWEGKHRIHALAESNAVGYRFVCVRGWDTTKATEEYQDGAKKFYRWGYLVYALHKLSGNGNEPTQLEDLC